MPRADDASYKLLFSSPELVRDLILGFIPDEWLHSLDYTTLERVSGSYITDDLRQRANDVVWRVRSGQDWVYLYLLIEFQSQPDRWMAVRMLTYVGLRYQDLIRNRELDESGLLPPVLPIVLYNGSARWTAATDIADLLPLPPGLVAQYQPRLQYLLLDAGELARRTDLSRLKNLAAAVIRLEHPENQGAILSLIDELNEWLEGEPELKRTFAIWIQALLAKRNDGIWALQKVTDLKELRMGLAEKMQVWAEEIRQESIQKGLQEGRQKGLQEGRQEGLAEGQAKGAQQAQILILQRQLTKRFGELPPQALAQIQAATVQQVETWLDRVLDAPTLDEVLASASS
ncbi:MAG: Rpn family recombination-promoting nuclease/putative transposase [Lautropia sp.]|nr:Rpn family recombination-promoting nuclease/putative transposase [Lautropia sp.]